MSREFLLDMVQKTKRILVENEVLNPSSMEEIRQLEERIKTFRAKILLVGAYSAGKTSLVNSILGGEEILKENITPETAVAAEIMYGEEESVTCVLQNGTEEHFDLSSVPIAAPKKCLKYIYRLDRPLLRGLADEIIVDMPGFDSGIEAHNKALLQYIGEAAAYLFVIDVTKGTINQSALDFLREIQRYTEHVSFIVTRCDKETQGNIDATKNEIADRVESVTGLRPEILQISSRDADAGERMTALIERLPFDALLMDKLNGDLAELLSKSIYLLETRLEAIDYNPFEIDKQIRQIEDEKRKLEREFARKKEEVRARAGSNMANAIVGDVRVALESHISELISAAQTGGNSFVDAVNAIVRPVLARSSEKNIQVCYEELVRGLDLCGRPQGVDPERTAGVLRGGIVAIETIAREGAAFAKAKKYMNVYRILSTGLAVTTSIIAPWMELIIIFLPDILTLVRKLFAPSAEEELRRRILQEVIPGISNQILPEIRQTMREIEQDMMDDLEREYASLIEAGIQTLQGLRAEKQHKETDMRDQKDKIVSGIEYLRRMQNELARA